LSLEDLVNRRLTELKAIREPQEVMIR